MTKLEELTALLVNEINDFNEGVEKLKKINEQLKTTKIKIDLKEYKSIIEEHQKQMAMHQNAMRYFDQMFESGIKQVKLYFIGLVVVCVFCLAFSVVIVMVAV